ncbi:MAG: YidC/Oxa1 family membrane protein insertase [bacterium]|nr:YidC/Oxa1 family membrane protein insertase [bacterium]
MEFISTIFNEALYRPIFNALIGIYNALPYHDIGLAIIILTILIRILLYPFSLKALRSQHKLQELQPKIKEVQEKHKANREEQAKRLMELYRTHRISPFSGCLPLLIQFPILIALYHAFLSGLKPDAVVGLYAFVNDPGTINHFFLGFIDLSKKNVYLALLAGATQFWQSKTSIPKAHGTAKEGQMANIMSTQMLYMMPIFTVILGITFPSGLALYWIVYTLFTVFQQWQMKRAAGTDTPDGDVAAA